MTDLLFVLERDEQDPEQRWRRRLRCGKCRIAQEPEDRWLGIRSWRGHVTLTEAAPFEKPGGRAAPKREQAEEDALSVLLRENGPMRRADIARALDRDSTDGTLRRAVDRLVDDGVVIPTDDGFVAKKGASS